MLPTAFAPLLAGDPQEIGGYRVIARLGAGGMGIVYLGVTQSGRRLAIKVVRPEFADDQEFRRRFQQEVGAAQRVQNLYTAPVIDADLTGPVPWLATAHVPGPSLAQVVQEDGPLPPASVQVLAAGVAEALQAIHKAGVIHRDLKPSNVLLAVDGPKVIDFGIARAADATPLTRTGGSVGTPQFMAPEQALGRPSTPALDVFAFGSLIFFAATGRSPFGDGPAQAVLFRIVQSEPDLTGCPPQLAPLIHRCLAKDPEQRPSIQEILHELTGVPAPGSVQWLPPALTSRISSYAAAPPPTVPAHPQPQPQPPARNGGNRSFLTGVAASAAVFLVLGVAAFFLARGDDSKPTETAAKPNNSAQAVEASTQPAAAPTQQDKPASPAPNGPAKAAGTQLGNYPNITLKQGQALSFTEDPAKPWSSTVSGDGDFSFQTLFYGDRISLLARGVPATYDSCKKATGTATYLAPTSLGRGQIVCVTTKDGIVALLKVNDIQSRPEDFLAFDLTVWQSTP